MTHGYYFHTPGQPSRWGVVDVGLKCVHSCRHCFYSFMDGSPDQFRGMRHARFHSKEAVIQQIEGLAENGFLGFDVTGGEPGAYPHIVEAIGHATSLGLSSRIITLGQFLHHKNLLERLLDAGLTDFRFSLHAHEADLFRKMTGGELDLLVGAMDKLQKRGFQYITNTTITADNYRHLPEIAKFIAFRPEIYASTFLLFMPYYQWSKPENAALVRVPYPDVAPYLRDAVAITEAAAIATTVRYAPLCTIAGLERNHAGVVSVRYDPHEWMNAIDHTADPEKTTLEQFRAMGRRLQFPVGEPSPGTTLVGVKGRAGNTELCAGRGDVASQQVSKVFPTNCAKCSAINVCDGVDAPYIRQHGDKHFVPYVNDDRGAMLDRERLAYSPAFFMKRKADGDVKSAVRRTMFPKRIGDNPLVSVVVTCFNYGKYLGKCLDSIEAQTYRNVEVIVVDDASTDDSYTVATKHLGNPVRGVIIRLEENQGQPAPCRNHGISKSRGELVMCLDADDWIESTYIEECVRQFRKHPEAAIVYPGTQCWKEDGETKADMFSAGPYSMETLLQSCIIVCASMYRREVWEATGGYKTNIRGSEDWNLWIEAAGLGYFGVPLPRQLFNYRRHADGIFESDVVPNFQAKCRQVVLNNSDLYAPEIVLRARAEEDAIEEDEWEWAKQAAIEATANAFIEGAEAD